MGIFSSNKILSIRKARSFQRAKNNPVIQRLKPSEKFRKTMDNTREINEFNRDIIEAGNKGLTKKDLSKIIGKYVAGEGDRISRKEGLELAKVARKEFKLLGKGYSFYRKNVVEKGGTEISKVSPKRKNTEMPRGKLKSKSFSFGDKKKFLLQNIFQVKRIPSSVKISSRVRRHNIKEIPRANDFEINQKNDKGSFFFRAIKAVDGNK